MAVANGEYVEPIANEPDMTVGQLLKDVMWGGLCRWVHSQYVKVRDIGAEPYEFPWGNPDFPGYRTIFEGNENPDGKVAHGFLANARARFDEDPVLNVLSRVVRGRRDERQQQATPEPDWSAIYNKIRQSPFMKMYYESELSLRIEDNDRRRALMRADEGYQEAERYWDGQITDARQDLDAMWQRGSSDDDIRRAERGLQSSIDGKRDMQRYMQGLDQFRVRDVSDLEHEAALEAVAAGESKIAREVMSVAATAVAGAPRWREAEPATTTTTFYSRMIAE